MTEKKKGRWKLIGGSAATKPRTAIEALALGDNILNSVDVTRLASSLEGLTSSVIGEATRINERMAGQFKALIDAFEEHTRRINEFAADAGAEAWLAAYEYSDTDDTRVRSEMEGLVLRELEHQAQENDDDIAQWALDNDDAENNPRDRFVRELHAHVANAFEFCAKGGDNGTRAQKLINRELSEEAASEFAKLADERLAVYVETAMGGQDTGGEYGATIRQLSVERRDRVDRGDLPQGAVWRWWIDVDQETTGRSDKAYPYLTALAAVLWKDHLRSSFQLEMSPAPFAVARVTMRGGDYTKIPKSAAAISWGFDGAGVTVGDNDYATQPTTPRARMVPRSWEIVRSDELREKQRQQPLALEYPGEDPLALALVGQPTSVIPAPGGKLLLLMLASTKPGHLVTGSIGALASIVYPDTRIQSSHRQQIAKVLSRVADLHAVLPDDTIIRCFDIRHPSDPNNVTADQTVGWAPGAFFTDLANRDAAKEHQLQGMPGDFIVNLTGVMRLPKRGAVLRHYVGMAALWNDARTPSGGNVWTFSPRHPLLSRTPADWAAKANALSSAGVKYKAHRKGRRQSLSDDKRNARRDLDDLHDLKMIQLEKDGRNSLRVLPPDELLEAYEEIRKKGTHRQ